MSTSSSNISEASTKLDGDSSPPSPAKGGSRARRAVTRDPTSNAQNVLLFLIAFRILNALSLRTFFQPDEFFQSLEPAWQIVFGRDSGLWLTWEWKQRLRSAIHPTIFATAYWIAHGVAQALGLAGASTAEVLIVAPKVLQGTVAALQDFYTWKLAMKVFGTTSLEAWAAIVLSICSPWQWFCSTRTFSNGLETTLTVAALYYWPWHWLPTGYQDIYRDKTGLRQDMDSSATPLDELAKLSRCLLLAGFACILRPTNAILWLTLVVMVMFRRRRRQWFSQLPLLKLPISSELEYFSLRTDTQNESVALMGEAIICGSLVLLVSAIVDRWFYNAWAFPPIKFLLFNVVQSLAVFYGKNDWHYYLSQGFPLLLTTALPFALTALARGYFDQSPRPGSTSLQRETIRSMTILCFVLPGILSLIAHKEVRFIYPLLPILHVVTAPVLVSFFGPAVSIKLSTLPEDLRTAAVFRRMLLVFLLSTNILISVYTTQYHGTGSLTAIDYLRSQYLTYYAPPDIPGSELVNPENDASPVMSVGFLMPCHSTPWRSHLVFPSIDAWALTCEPPLHLSSADKSAYLDEADQFYADPASWLRIFMSRIPPKPQRGFKSPASQRRSGDISSNPNLDRRRSDQVRKSTKRPWPEYLLFFQQLEPTLYVLLRGSGYTECWRGFNTHWHDDWRRQGDIVAWCLYPERRIVEDPSGFQLLTNSKRIIQQATETTVQTFKKSSQFTQTSFASLIEKIPSSPWAGRLPWPPQSWSWSWPSRPWRRPFSFSLPSRSMSWESLPGIKKQTNKWTTPVSSGKKEEKNLWG